MYLLQFFEFPIKFIMLHGTQSLQQFVLLFDCTCNVCKLRNLSLVDIRKICNNNKKTQSNLRKSLATTVLANCTASCTISNSQTDGSNVNLKPKSLCNLLRMRADIFTTLNLFHFSLGFIMRYSVIHTKVLRFKLQLYCMKIITIIANI